MSRFHRSPLPLDHYAFSRRKGKKMNFFRFSVFFLLGVGCICIGIAYFILFGNFWSVRSIRVEGSRLVDNSVLISAIASEFHARSPIAAGILGQNHIGFWMFYEKPFEIPWMPEVKDIRVNVDFSSRVVNISVRERSVAAVVCVENNAECYAIDEGGIVFSKIPWVEGVLVPRFEEKGEIFLGEKYFRKEEWFKNILSTLSILRESNIVPERIVRGVDNTEEWEAIISSGIHLYFNLNFIPDDLGKIIEDIRARGGFSGVSYFDFRVQNRVYYK